MAEFETQETCDIATTTQFGAIKAEIAEPNLRARGLSADEAEAVESLPENSALLIVLKGPNLGARFLLDTERTTVGRRPRADIFLDDATVSRRHAEFIQLESGDYLVQDSGSLNGTYVNKEQVESAVLHDGDEVQIGKYRLTFHESPAKTAARK